MRLRAAIRPTATGTAAAASDDRRAVRPQTTVDRRRGAVEQPLQRRRTVGSLAVDISLVSRHAASLPQTRAAERRVRAPCRRTQADPWHDRMVRPGVPTLADAADPLGKLQRGLGSGYLWALDADRTISHALLLHCVFNDPRWDRQLDDRDEYHATLALDLQLHTGALELWLRDTDEELPDTTYDVLGMLGRMAVRGHADARRVLRDYVAYGRYWRERSSG